MAAAVDVGDAQGAVIALFAVILPVLAVMFGVRKITKTINRT